MLFVIEGGDGTGKTTLAAELADALRVAYPAADVEVRRTGPPPPGQHPIHTYGDPTYDYRPGVGHHIVYDRFHAGEWVYPDILGRSTRADRASWRWLNLLLAARGAVLIHCDRDPARAAIAVAERGDDLVSPDQAARAVRAFSELLPTVTATLPRLVHDVDRPHAAPFTVADAVANARDLETRVAPLHRFVTYIGPSRPRYLLLGDVRHEIGRHHPTQRDAILATRELTREYGPAFGPLRGTSGHYLLDSLPDELLRAGVGLANACDVDDVAELHRALGHPPAVALGTNAWQASVRANVAVGGVPHPQFVRRFHHRYAEAYGRLILDTLEAGRNHLSWRP